MSVVAAFVALIAFDLAAMIAALALIGVLIPRVRRPGIGRIVFFALFSLKGWAAAVFGWFVLVAVAPSLSQRDGRIFVYFGLVLYEGAQSVAVIVALVRWRRRARREGIGDGRAERRGLID